jgi:hypothetical protein
MRFSASAPVRQNSALCVGQKLDKAARRLSYAIDFIGAPKGTRTPVFAVRGRHQSFAVGHHDTLSSLIYQG